MFIATTANHKVRPHRGRMFFFVFFFYKPFTSSRSVCVFVEANGIIHPLSQQTFEPFNVMLYF